MSARIIEGFSPLDYYTKGPKILEFTNDGVNGIIGINLTEERLEEIKAEKLEKGDTTIYSVIEYVENPPMVNTQTYMQNIYVTDEERKIISEHGIDIKLVQDGTIKLEDALKGIDTTKVTEPKEVIVEAKEEVKPIKKLFKKKVDPEPVQEIIEEKKEDETEVIEIDPDNDMSADQAIDAFRSWCSEGHEDTEESTIGDNEEIAKLLESFKSKDAKVDTIIEDLEGDEEEYEAEEPAVEVEIVIPEGGRRIPPEEDMFGRDIIYDKHDNIYSVNGIRINEGLYDDDEEEFNDLEIDGAFSLVEEGVDEDDLDADISEIDQYDDEEEEAKDEGPRYEKVYFGVERKKDLSAWQRLMVKTQPNIYKMGKDPKAKNDKVRKKREKMLSKKKAKMDGMSDIEKAAYLKEREDKEFRKQYNKFQNSYYDLNDKKQRKKYDKEQGKINKAYSKYMREISDTHKCEDVFELISKRKVKKRKIEMGSEFFSKKNKWKDDPYRRYRRHGNIITVSEADSYKKDFSNSFMRNLEETIMDKINSPVNFGGDTIVEVYDKKGRLKTKEYVKGKKKKKSKKEKEKNDKRIEKIRERINKSRKKGDSIW